MQTLNAESISREQINEPASGALSAFVVPQFRCLWIAFSFASVSTWLQGVALDYATVTVEGKSLDIGLVNALKALTFVSVALLSGPAIDRYVLRRILIATHLATAAGSLLVGLFTSSHQFTLLIIGVYTIYNAVVLGVDHPSRQMLVPQLVPRRSLVNAVAWNSLTYVGAGALGPAFAFTVVHALGLSGPFFLRALLFVIAAAVLFMTILPLDHKNNKAAPTIRDFADGVRYSFNTPVLRSPFLILIITGVLVAPFQALLPMIAKTWYKLSPLSSLDGSKSMPREILVLGWLHTAFGIGAIFGAAVLILASKHDLKISFAWTAGALFCMAIFLFANQRQLPLGLLMLTCAGTCSMYMQASAEATLQKCCDPSMLGRVMSVFSICVVGLWSLAAPLLTQLSDLLGPSTTLSACSTVALILLIVGLVRSLVANNTNADATLPTGNLL